MKLTTFFQNELVKLGYPDDLTIEYSLGYCQGDGMAFYGQLQWQHLEAIYKRIYSGEIDSGMPAVQRVKNLMKLSRWDELRECAEDNLTFCLDIKIGKNSYGSHYSHWNTMQLEDNSDSWSIDEDNPEEMVLAELWSDFFDDLKQDIKETSQRLECYGYAIIEAGCFEDKIVWERSTPRFIVRVTEMPDEFFDMDDWDEEKPNDNYQGFLEGKDRWLALKAEVLSEDGETVFGVAALHGIVCGNEDQTYGGYRSELVTEAIANARELIARSALKAA